MPLQFLVRILTSLLSLLFLGAAAYLLWSWHQGDWVRGADGSAWRVRDDWRLWTGLGLLAWSFLGRFPLTLILARGGGRPTSARPRSGLAIPGAEGAQLHLEVDGRADGPPLVLTHGWGLDSTVWSRARADLGDRFRVISWDLPGLGQSRLGPSGRLTLEHMAADLEEVIARAGPEPVVLVGHSIGGMTILTLARDRPELFAERVRGVVLVNTTYTCPLKTTLLSGLGQALRRPVVEPLLRLAIWLQPLAWLAAWQSYLSGSAHLTQRLGFGAHVTRAELNHTALLATRNPPGVQAKGNLAMFRWDASSVLARLRVPVLILGGEADIITRPQASRDMAAAIPGAELQLAPGANHMGFLEQSEAYDAAIATFATAAFARAA